MTDLEILCTKMQRCKIPPAVQRGVLDAVQAGTFKLVILENGDIRLRMGSGNYILSNHRIARLEDAVDAFLGVATATAGLCLVNSKQR